MAKLGIVWDNYTYAEFPPGTGGSHVPDWAQNKLFVAGGIKTACIIVMPDAGVLDTHREDVRRSRQEAGVERLYVRLGDWGELNSAANRFAQIDGFVGYCLQWYPEVTLLGVNELRLDLTGVTALGALEHTRDLRSLLRAKYGNRVRLGSPTVNAYSEQSERDLAEIAAHPDWYDVFSANVYPHNRSELTGKWSLPWFLAMAPAGKPVVVWEYNGHRTMEGFRMTADERTALLPYLHAQMLDSPAEAALWFIRGTASGDLLEMATNARQMADAFAVVQGWRPDATETPPPTSQLPEVPAGAYDPQKLWDYAARLAGGPGYNESIAFAGWARDNPDKGPFGFPLTDVLGYDRDWPYLVMPTTTGLFLYCKADGRIAFARTPEAAANPFA